jgi:hypothetical protein
MTAEGASPYEQAQIPVRLYEGMQLQANLFWQKQRVSEIRIVELTMFAWACPVAFERASPQNL